MRTHHMEWKIVKSGRDLPSVDDYKTILVTTLDWWGHSRVEIARCVKLHGKKKFVDNCAAYDEPRLYSYVIESKVIAWMDVPSAFCEEVKE